MDGPGRPVREGFEALRSQGLFIGILKQLKSWVNRFRESRKMGLHGLLKAFDSLEALWGCGWIDTQHFLCGSKDTVLDFGMDD